MINQVIIEPLQQGMSPFANEKAETQAHRGVQGHTANK